MNTLHVHRSKELDDNSPSKDDKKDPRVIADLVREGRFFEPYDPQGDYAEIRSLFNVRESVEEHGEGPEPYAGMAAQKLPGIPELLFKV